MCSSEYRFTQVFSFVERGLRFDEDQQMRAVLRDYMPFYNGARIHSSLNCVPPATHEQQAP